MGDTQRKGGKNRKRKKKKVKDNEPCNWDEYEEFLHRVFKDNIILIKKPLMGTDNMEETYSTDSDFSYSTDEDFETDMTSESPQGRKGRQPRIELQREYSDLTKQRHERIVKKLLDEFDLEETEEKYRCSQGPISYVPKSKGLGDYQFRSNLRRLMGSDVIHLNDRKWNNKLEMRLREEYEKQLDRKEDELAEAEVNRIRKLKLDGVIPITDDTDIHIYNEKKKKTKGRKRRGSNTRRKGSHSPSNRRQRSTSAPTSRPKTVGFYKPPEEVRTQVEVEVSPSQSETLVHDTKARSQSETVDTKTLSQSETVDTKVVENSDRRPESKHENRSSTSFSDNSRTSDEDIGHLTTLSNVKRKKVPKPIAELYDEESVDGLYSLAERLVVHEQRQPTVQIQVQNA